LQTANGNLNETRLSIQIDALKRLTPSLFRHVLCTAAFSPDIPENVVADISGGYLFLEFLGIETLKVSERFVPCDNPLESLPVLFDNNLVKLTSLLDRYDKHTCREWYATWDSLDYVNREMCVYYFVTASFLFKLNSGCLKCAE